MYKAPEQESGKEYDSRADVFSLGVILFEMLSDFQTFSEKVEEILSLRKTGKVNEEFRLRFPSQSLLIEKMVSTDHSIRLFATQILEQEEFMIWKHQVETDVEAGL